MNTVDQPNSILPPDLGCVGETEQYIIGYDVIDAFNRSIGRIETLWRDLAGRVLFAGVATEWSLGKSLVLPLLGAQVSSDQQAVQFPYPSDTIRDAPAVSSKTVLTGLEQQNSYATFHLAAPASVRDEHMQGNGRVTFRSDE